MRSTPRILFLVVSLPVLIVAGCASTGGPKGRTPDLDELFLQKKDSSNTYREVVLSEKEIAEYVLAPILSVAVATAEYRHANLLWPTSASSLYSVFEKREDPLFNKRAIQGAKFAPTAAGDLQVAFDSLFPSGAHLAGQAQTKLMFQFHHVKDEVVRVGMTTEPQTRFCLPPQDGKSSVVPDLMFGVAMALLSSNQQNPAQPDYRSRAARSGRLCIGLPPELELRGARAPLQIRVVPSQKPVKRK